MLLDLLGYVGVALAVVTTVMQTMIPLRALSMVANLVFMALAGAHHAYPACGLQIALLLINGYRLWEMVNLTRRVERAAGGDQAMDWLKPFMSRRRYRAGETVFRKGAPADEMIYLVSGRLRLAELGTEIPPGEVLGELGLLAPDGLRTQTVQCVEDAEVLVMAYDDVKQLYFQNPQFGFYFLRLATTRLFHNLERLERRVAGGGPEAAMAAGD